MFEEVEESEVAGDEEVGAVEAEIVGAMDFGDGLFIDHLALGEIELPDFVLAGAGEVDFAIAIGDAIALAELSGSYCTFGMIPVDHPGAFEDEYQWA